MEKTVVYSGNIEFNSSNKIISYEGPKIDTLPNRLSQKDAIKIAKDHCEVDKLALEESSMSLSLVNDVVYWRFRLDGEIPDNCFYAECSLNGNTGKAEIDWSCGGLL